MSDFRNINEKLKCKLYPVPKINEMLFKLEGFHYDTPLVVNIRHYNILII